MELEPLVDQQAEVIPPPSDVEAPERGDTHKYVLDVTRSAAQANRAEKSTANKGCASV